MFNNFLIQPDKSLKSALKLISKNGCKTVLVVENDIFLGTLSDGDIRKAVIYTKENKNGVMMDKTPRN